ncbi:MAG TPA: NAD(+)/NADH kinase [Solirubrobacteraceae bacterium]|nr:NAD(+)/NADH kinase [Solirubrobacteraceae bacterium]
MSGRAMTVLTHRSPADTATALQRLMRAAAQAGMTLRLDAEETRKHRLTPAAGLELHAQASDRVELCLVLGGDGTILKALQLYAGTEVPVFAVNFGEIGFLATVEPEELDEGLARAFAGDFELLHLPAIVLDPGAGEPARARIASPELAGGEAVCAALGGCPAINDVAIHRKVGERVAEIAYALQGETVGSVRCDGLVISTPAGSTGYNLANGGPVMAWGVEGCVVSFIAPHSLTARALVVAPNDRLTIDNRSDQPLDVAIDGRPAGELAPGATIDVRFEHSVGTIAQLAGTSFYRRLREKFGRLAR